MIALVILLSAAVLTQARPEAGYSYPIPAEPALTLPGPSIGGSHGISSINIGTSGSSHGTDINQISLTTSGSGTLGLSGGSSSLLHGGSPTLLHGGSSSLLHGSSSGLIHGGSSSLLHGGSSGLLHGGSSGLLHGGSSGLLHGGSSGLLQGGSSSLVQGGNFGSFSGSSSSFTGGFSSGSALGGGSTLVQKHIYVHVPPPEPEDLQPQRIIPVAPAQKHYKIIFIKAPSPPTPTVPAIPVQQQNEEKTLVYVLVKKPEEAPELTIPAPVPTQPSKPEVYFIRYKTQKDHSGSLAGSSLGGAGLIDDSSSALVGSVSGVSGGLTSFTSSHGSSSSSSFISGSSASSGGLSTSYGPPGHVPGPY
ncbi:uncharacterized protein [Euwallacea similis]|uniref:uncharacterized protein isoform X1 n=1 Tax=Euwallacea similis TaxID=1736056 RepID=UPI00344FAE29